MKRKTCIFKNFVMLFMAIGLFTVFIGCDDKNDEVGPLRQEVQALRADLTKSFDTKVDAKTKELQAQLDQAKKQIADLSKRREGMSAEELQAKIDAATSNLITITTAQTMYEKYVENVKAQLEGAATVAQLEALKKDASDFQSQVNTGLSDLSTKMGTINQKIATLEALVGGSKGDLDKALDELKASIKAEFGNEFEGLAESLDTEVKKLNQKIDTQKSDLEKMMKEYKDANAELIKANGKLANANKGEIATLKSDVKKLKDRIQKLENSFSDQQKSLILDVLSPVLNSRLTSLVLLPDYIGRYYGDPVVVFSPISTPCDNTKITPLVEIKYMVSPSTVTVADIDVDNLKFVYNDPTYVREMKTQAEKVAPKAKFVSLKDGVLTVKASLNSEETWNSKGGNKIDQLMLQVPSKKGDFVVSSDWVKVLSKPINNYYLGKQNENGSGRQALPTTLARAKAEATVVNLAYDESLDLNDFVKTLYGAQGVLNVENYGLSYSYDLNDSEGNPIKYELGSNKTDQQQFIKLNGSTVTTRVYAIDGQNPASVDRTPIVRVILKSNKCDEMDKEAFIKINIVRSQKDNIKPVDFAPKKDIIASCEDFDLRVGTQEMNEKFYAKAGLSKQEFHRNYTLQYDPSDVDGVGTVSQVRDYNDRESYNLVWNVSSAEQWNALGTGKDAVNEKEISRVVEYRSGNSVIKVTFKATLKRPSIDLSNLKLDNYWSANKQYARFNINVPEKGSKDSNKAKIQLDIDNIFDNVKKDNGDIVIKGWNEKYDYDYTFVEKQPYTNVKTDKEGEVIKVYGEGKLLYAQLYNTKTKTDIGNREEVGKIFSRNIIDYRSTPLAKYLLNIAPESMKAEIQLTATDKCGHDIDSKISNGKNTFIVHFLRPINVEPVSVKNFVDGVDVGDKGSILDIKDIVVLSDWRKNVTGNQNFNFLPNNKNYYNYYGVEKIEIDENNIKVQGLKADGESISDKPGSIDVYQSGAVDLSKYEYGKVTYKNNGTTLNKEFKLIIPVKVTYKWGEVNTKVTVNVKPTSDASRKRVK